MENEEAVAAALLPVAKRVARILYYDPEAESIAGWALLRAIRSYDGTTPLEAYVVHCVRIDVYHYWRKLRVRRKTKLQTEEFWETASYKDPPTKDVVLSELEWKLLHQKYELRWPFDVVARRNQMTVSHLRRVLEEAIDKLLRHVSS